MNPPQVYMLTTHFRATFYPVCWAHAREQEIAFSLLPPN